LILDLLPDSQPFLVVKQIAVLPDHRKSGIGRGLLQRLLDTHRDSDAPVFSAIVTRPRNEASERFHATLWFRPLLAVPVAEHRPLPRLIWYRWLDDFAADAGSTLIEAPAPNTEAQTGEFEKRLVRALDLYKHEDALNWKKFGLVSTYFFALAAAAWALAMNSQAQNWQFVSAIAFLSVAGAFVLFVTSVQVRSGVQFLSRHKLNARLLEAELILRRGLAGGVVLRVPKTSRTVRWLPWMPVAALIMWCLICGALAISMVQRLMLHPPARSGGQVSVATRSRRTSPRPHGRNPVRRQASAPLRGGGGAADTAPDERPDQKGWGT